MSKLFFNRRESWHIIFGTSPISKLWCPSNECMTWKSDMEKKGNEQCIPMILDSRLMIRWQQSSKLFKIHFRHFLICFLVSVEKQTSFNAAAVLWLFCMQDQLEERLPCSPLCVTVRVIGHYFLPGKELPPPCCFLKPSGMVNGVKKYLSLFLFLCWSVAMTLHVITIILPE